MRKSLRTTFCEIWEAERKTNRKLGFYNSIKETFGFETYLNIGLSYQEQKRLAQFRTISHRYKAETGRYKQKHESVSVVNRICEYCSPNSEVNKRKVSIKEKFIFTSQSNYILYMIYTKLVMNSKSVYKFT